MPSPALDPIDSIDFVGGRLCLDFINTANWIDDQPVDDRLADAAAARIWAARKGLRGDVGEPGELRRLRQALRAMLSPTARSDDAACAVLNGARATPPAPILADGRLSPPSTDDGWLRRALADSASDLLVSLDRRRLKQCPGPRCGWLFVDESPNNRRRWCSMATCGNRAKASRHYRRRRAAPE